MSSKNEPILYEINGLPGIQAQAGDNAASLSRKAKISLSSFLRYNDMGERDPVLVNDVYYLAKKRKKALVPFTPFARMKRPGAFRNATASGSRN